MENSPEGYSYQEICRLTEFSYTKVNRCLTEGRRAFLRRFEGLETGSECERFAPALSALADGELGADDLRDLRGHVKGCATCRASLREFRAVPAKVAAIAPTVPIAAAAAPGGAREMAEAALGSLQHKWSLLGDRAHQAAELIGGQKTATAACCAAAIAGGGAVTATQTVPLPGGADSVQTETRELDEGDRAAKPPVPQPVDTPGLQTAPPAGSDPAVVAPPAPTPAAEQTAPQPQPEPAPPSPANEFAPSPAAQAAGSSSRASPAPVQGGGSPAPGGEFAP